MLFALWALNFLFRSIAGTSTAGLLPRIMEGILAVTIFGLSNDDLSGPTTRFICRFAGGLLPSDAATAALVCATIGLNDGDGRVVRIFGAGLGVLFKMRVPVGTGEVEFTIFGTLSAFAFRVFVFRELNTLGLAVGTGDLAIAFVSDFVIEMGTGEDVLALASGLIVRPCAAAA